MTGMMEHVARHESPVRGIAGLYVHMAVVAAYPPHGIPWVRYKKGLAVCF